MSVKCLLYFLITLTLIYKGVLLNTDMTTFYYQGNLFALSKYEIFSSARSKTILDCARFCSKLPTCRAMSYNKGLSYCIAYNASVSHDLINSSQWMFYIRESDISHTDTCCPRDWTKGVDECYWLSGFGDSDVRTHAEATAHCRQMNASMLSIQNEAK
ncbi:unnamed protein product, partial [Owenia fusiformis]